MHFTFILAHGATDELCPCLKCLVWLYAKPGLYLECSVGGVWGMEVPTAAGSRSRAQKASPEAIGTMKYCAYKNWFLCIFCLYFIPKICTDLKDRQRWLL